MWLEKYFYWCGIVFNLELLGVLAVGVYLFIKDDVWKELFMRKKEYITKDINNSKV